MMKNAYFYFYIQPMWRVYAETIAMYVIWTVLMLLTRGKARRIIAVIGTVVSLVLIALCTIYGRRIKEAHELSLIPFITFTLAKTQPEYYRTMYMNTLLFIPLGLTLPFALYEKIKHNVLVTIAAGALLSACIEIIQYVFYIGKCEIDDVLMNTLGVIIGATGFLVFRGVQPIRAHIKRSFKAQE